MFRTIGLCVVLALPVRSAAQDAVRYVSDEISIVLRAGPSADSAPQGSLNSGAKLELLETRNNYARVITGDGRDGWVPERYLKSEPSARERSQRVKEQLAEARKQLADSTAELKKLKDEQARLLKDFARIAESPGAPAAAELVQEAEQLRAKVRQLERERSELAAAGESSKAREVRQTMLLGGALVAVGLVLALLLHWLWPKRRWGGL